MADKPKFTTLDEAAAQLGVTKERLNELREDGKVRAYRDGTSWKFRSEDVDKLIADPGLLEGEPSGIDLQEISLESSELSSLSLEPADAAAAASDLDLDTLEEPTVRADPEPPQAESSSDAPLGDEISLEDEEESILLSEDELGDSLERPPSTIIGRSQLQDEPSDDDLQIAAEPTQSAGMSDVRLADETDDPIEELLSGDDKADGAEMFEDLEELEIDLEAESSRILEAQDVAAAQQAAKEMAAKSDDDLELAGSSLTLDESGADAGATGVHDPSVKPPGSQVELAADEDDELELDLAGSGVESGVELQADGSDDMVLDSDEDFSLSSADSGINLKPSDSGLALDDDSFALGGSAVGSSLDLGDSLGGDSFAVGGGTSEVSLEGSTAFASSPDFNLQPSDDEDDEDEEDSSQIIALDAIEEGGEEVEEGPMLSDAAVVAGSPAAMNMGQTPVMAPEASFPGWIVAFLGLSSTLMIVSAIMATDLLRSMWAWDESYSLESPLIQGFLGLIGLGS